jgi:hypothetical protein
MTRARALKEIIRARSAKTGERYTAARRHVLNELRPRTQSVVRSTPVPVSATTKSAAPATSSKGGVSDATSRERRPEKSRADDCG